MKYFYTISKGGIWYNIKLIIEDSIAEKIGIKEDDNITIKANDREGLIDHILSIQSGNILDLIKNKKLIIQNKNGENKTNYILASYIDLITKNDINNINDTIDIINKKYYFDNADNAIKFCRYNNKNTINNEEEVLSCMIEEYCLNSKTKPSANNISLNNPPTNLYNESIQIE